MQELTDNTSVADRLAAKLRESDFGALMDEEALTKISREAIERAFFRDRTDGSSYHSKKLPPLVVEIAEKQFRTEIEERMKPIVAEITKSEEFQDALIKAAILQIPSAIQGMGYNIVQQTFMTSQNESNDGLAFALANKLRTMRSAGTLG